MGNLAHIIYQKSRNPGRCPATLSHSVGAPRPTGLAGRKKQVLAETLCRSPPQAASAGSELRMRLLQVYAFPGERDGVGTRFWSWTWGLDQLLPNSKAAATQRRSSVILRAIFPSGSCKASRIHPRTPSLPVPQDFLLWNSVRALLSLSLSLFNLLSIFPAVTGEDLFWNSVFSGSPLLLLLLLRGTLLDWHYLAGPDIPGRWAEERVNDWWY